MKVSVIIPCFNVENYIEECVHSVINQTYKKIEIICIDNNSKDNTWGKLKEIKKKHSNLILEKENTPGANAARNRGLILSTGQWLQFLDADDIILPKKIEHQIRLINGKQDVSFIAGSCYKQNIQKDVKEVKPLTNNPFHSLFMGRLGNTCANLWCKQCVIAIGGWNEKLQSSQEADLMFRLLIHNSNIIYDNKFLTLIRERPHGQISKIDPANNWKRLLHNRLKIFRWVKEELPKVYLQNKDSFDNKLFEMLKIESKYSLKSSISIYNETLKGNYRPSNYKNHSTKAYIILYQLIGFKYVENLRKIIGMK
ncbi:MAG TPA: glycosyltransferase family 2 protein [Epulopiscium sp.]|nr:glycosyltransferase family 2 protein [Candidatus Epulonipiscium sp.]